jgi:uncharacterized membrane protein YdbT with pleckstrin-like domain
MSLPENLLGKDESVVVHLRTHPKVIIVPVLLGGVVLFGAIMAWMFMPLSWHPWSTMFVGIVALVLLGWWTVAPVLRWLTTTYTVTTHRLITRRGILNKSGQDLPLHSISNVSYDRSLSDRVFRCGTLHFTTSAEAPVMLHDIPNVEAVGVQVSELLAARFKD